VYVLVPVVAVIAINPWLHTLP